MLTSHQSLIGGLKQQVTAVSPATQQQIRHFSRRRIAYPSYKAPKLGRTHKKDHRTTLRYQMQCFLGKKNYKNEYLDNRYFDAPKDHRPNYITPFSEQGSPLVDYKTGQVKNLKGEVVEGGFVPTRNFEDALRPFPHNSHCKTGFNLSKRDRDQIYKKIAVDGIPAQKVAVDMGIKIPRLEATVKLREIEKKWGKRVSILLRETLE